MTPQRRRAGEGGVIVMRAASRSRVLLAATIAALVLAAWFLPRPAAGSSSAVPRCLTAQLRLKFVDMQAATGHRFIDYAFKNVGARKCSLRGYPTVVLLDKRGHVIHSAHAKVAHFPISPIRTVVIGSRKSAFFSFTWADGAFCPGRAFTFYDLRVSPPNNAVGFRPHLGKTPACDASARRSAVRPKRFPF